VVVGAQISPLTHAHNRKCPFESIEESRAFRKDVVGQQIRTWRSMLPKLIRAFSKIKDPRRAKSIKHKLVVLMLFGLFAFVFRLSSRREMNRELTDVVIFDHLKTLFPELQSIPHADTLARLLKTINPADIEATHVQLIKDLIRKKKFKKLLIQGYLPITVDGTQKMYRDGALQDPRWCERHVGRTDDQKKQQYVYVLEANISLRNGLSIPLVTEYLHRNNNQLQQDHGKQDNETTAFERLANTLKRYFPRLKMIFFLDAMFATQGTMGALHKQGWHYVINLPKKKLTDFAKRLNKKRKSAQSIPNQAAYRKRWQQFYWDNNLVYGYDWALDVSLVGCDEQYDEVNKTTGEIDKRHVSKAWISSIPLSIDNVHELINCGVRKLGLMEDCFNTEKNRGYRYKHAFCYDWNGMQGFHNLMRLGHAINVLCAFTKALKKYMRDFGCSAILKLIKDTLFSPWLSREWYQAQTIQTPQLRLQLE